MHADSTPSVASFPATAYRAAEAYLERSIGLDPQTVGSAAIARAVRLRMEACGDRDEATFLARLGHDAEEHRRFIDEVVVPESWFFRDPPVFDALRHFAARFAASPERPPLRILSAPCAAGEEPYSAAIALLETGLSPDHFRIDATDISHAALARAAAATYSANAFRGTDVAFRHRWFRSRGTAAELDATVKERVRFFWANLLDESFAADHQPYDVIFCRNLMIYLTADARSRVERTIDRLLAPDGLLMLGAAEPPILKGAWIPVSRDAAFTLRRGAPALPPLPAAPPMHRPAVTAALLHDGPSRTLVDVPQPSTDPGHSPRSGDREAPVAPQALTSEDLLREAHALAGAGRHREALELCQRHQQTAGPSAQVFFQMGMLYQIAGELERAEDCLHKTLYMDPDRDDAFLSLSHVAAQRGDHGMAAHYRQAAARVLARKGAS